MVSRSTAKQSLPPPTHPHSGDHVQAHFITGETEAHKWEGLNQGLLFIPVFELVRSPLKSGKISQVELEFG